MERHRRRHNRMQAALHQRHARALVEADAEKQPEKDFVDAVSVESPSTAGVSQNVAVFGSTDSIDLPVTVHCTASLTNLCGSRADDASQATMTSSNAMQADASGVTETEGSSTILATVENVLTLTEPLPTTDPTETGLDHAAAPNTSRPEPSSTQGSNEDRGPKVFKLSTTWSDAIRSPQKLAGLEHRSHPRKLPVSAELRPERDHEKRRKPPKADRVSPPAHVTEKTRIPSDNSKEDFGSNIYTRCEACGRLSLSAYSLGSKCSVCQVAKGKVTRDSFRLTGGLTRKRQATVVRKTLPTRAWARTTFIPGQGGQEAISGGAAAGASSADQLTSEGQEARSQSTTTAGYQSCELLRPPLPQRSVSQSVLVTAHSFDGGEPTTRCEAHGQDGLQAHDRFARMATSDAALADVAACQLTPLYRAPPHAQLDGSETTLTPEQADNPNSSGRESSGSASSRSGETSETTSSSSDVSIGETSPTVIASESAASATACDIEMSQDDLFESVPSPPGTITDVSTYGMLARHDQQGTETSSSNQGHRLVLPRQDSTDCSAPQETHV